MDHLTASSAYATAAILEDAVDKLAVLTAITPDLSAHRSELTQLIGEEISKGMQRQRELETGFGELVEERDGVRSVSRAKLQEKEQQIRTMTTEIRQSAQSLTRVLKENPHVVDHLAKIQDERSTLLHSLNRTVRELKDPVHSFSALYVTVVDEKNHNERKHRAQARYREALAAQTELSANLAEEKESHAATLSARDEEIAGLKEKLQVLKERAAKESTLADADASAHTECMATIFQRALDQLQERAASLTQEIESERFVYDRNSKFLKARTEFLVSEAERWKEKLAQDTSELQSRIRSLQEVYNSELVELEALQGRWKEEKEKEAQEELARQRKVEEEILQEAVKTLRERWAVRTISSIYTEFKNGTLKRKRRKKKKGKKGSKGKKGKKGKGKKGKSKRRKR